MIAATNSTASPMVENTALMERSMKTVVSFEMSTRIPSGRSSMILGNSAYSARASASGLAVDCLISPSATADLPLKRTEVRSDAAATSTRPTSLMRTG